MILIKLLKYLPADFTHDISGTLLRHKVLTNPFNYKIPELKGFRLGKFKLNNPLGISAGIDKSGDFLKNLLTLGLGFITIGSVTLHPRGGNPRPRILRVPRKKAMINCMGLPSKGIHYVINKLREVESTSKRSIIITSIAGFSLGEFTVLTEIMNKSCTEFIELNISCPNISEKLEWFRSRELMRTLIQEISSICRKDILIKLPPLHPEYFDIQNMKYIINLTSRLGITGISLVNTLRIKEPRLSIGFGGLSGYPIYVLLKYMVRKIRSWSKDLAIIATGGVFHGWQVWDLLKHGANAVGIVTAFTYEGVYALYRISKEFLKCITYGKGV